MKYTFILLLLCITGIANATDYYVSASGNNANNGTSSTTPWQSLSKVQTVCNNGTIKAGDRILFKKGESFTGTFFMTNLWGHTAKSGTATNPITFSSYGTGAKPVFQYPQGGSVPTEERIILWFIGVDYIVVDGLNFTDLVAPTNNKVSAANCGFAVYIGIQEEATSNHCTVKNVDISLCGMGIAIVGDYNIITNSTLTNFKNLKNTSGGIDDYGANAVTITGSDNQILNNYISGAWAYSSDFGWNGGACEMYNTCNRNKIMYNTFVDCEGISEYGGQSGNNAADNLIAYNKIINCGQLIWVNADGPFAVQVSNIQCFNNAIVENNLSRFSGPNVGAGNSHPQAQYPSQQLFAYSSNPSANVMFNLKNNVFYLSTGIDIVNSSNASKTTHQNNIYKLSAGGATNFSLAGTELSTSSSVFASTTATDPVAWNFAPATTSPAIDFGQNVSLTKDFAGSTVPSVPNAGILESSSTPPPGSTLAVSSTAGTITCNAGTTTVTVTATGGTSPYTGTGTFTVNAGTFTYNVTDAAGTVKSTSVTIAQPAAIGISVPALTVPSSTSTTSAVITASGGTPAYTYKLNSGTYQSGSTFTGLLAGTYSVTVKDSRGCTSVKSFTITVNAGIPLVVSAAAGIISCNGGTTTVTVTASGGRSPYTGTGTFTAAAGTKTYTVTDANGTAKTTSITIVQPSAIQATVSFSAITFNGGKTKVTVTASGGTAPYTYKLNNGLYRTNNVFSNVKAGNHTIRVKDARGCILVKTFTVTQPAGKGIDPSANPPLYSTNSSTDTNSSKTSLEVSSMEDQQESMDLTVSAFPNPSASEFSLIVKNTGSDEIIKLTVVNLNGQKVYENKVRANEKHVFGRNFISGAYFVKVSQGTQNKIVRLIKTL